MTSTTKNKIRLWAVIFWLSIWYMASLIIDNEMLLVSPIKVISKLSELVAKTEFWMSIGTSMIRIVSGLLFAIVLGVVLAVASAKYKRVRECLTPFIATIKTIPVASFIILVLIWVSSDKLSTFISFIMVFPLIYTNVLIGIENMDIKLYEMAEIFEIKTYVRIKYIYFRQVAPYFKSALEVALGMCWKAGVAAEVIGLPNGTIGENLYESKVFFDTASLFAWTVVIICISILFEKIFMALFKKAQNKVGSVF